jgi:hypothetical protein
LQDDSCGDIAALPHGCSDADWDAVPTGMQGIVPALRHRPESGILRMCGRGWSVIHFRC